MKKHVQKKKHTFNGEWSFDQAVNYLDSAIQYEISSDLKRIEHLLSRFGNPQNACPAIHVAGTIGKGSVSAMLSFIAAAANKKVGVFTSPYLTNFNERIRLIDGKRGLQTFFSDSRNIEIPDEDFTQIMAMVAFESEVVKAQGYDLPTSFEMLTTVAFIYFAEKDCDLIILETGSGGKLDATNITQNKMANIITAVNHEYIRNADQSIQKIAKEKAGIIRKGIPTIFYNPYDTELSDDDAAIVFNTVQETAKKQESNLILVKQADVEIKSSFLRGQSFTYQESGPFSIQFGGDYHCHNAALAVETAKLFTDLRTIEEGLSIAKWPGRLECLSQEPFILLDGAHNSQGASGLKKYLEKFLVDQRFIVLFGASHNEDFVKTMDTFLDSHLYKLDQMICTESHFDGKIPAKNLAQSLVKNLKVSKFRASKELSSDDLKEGLASGSLPLYNNKILYSKDIDLVSSYAFELAKQEKMPLVVFGSLHLASDLRKILKDLLEG